MLPFSGVKHYIVTVFSYSNPFRQLIVMQKAYFVPVQFAEISELGILQSSEKHPIPFFSDFVTAGFPSPAEQYVEKSLDLNDLCIRNPAASYFVRVRGDSMVGAGINTGDVLVIDRSLPHSHNSIVIARVGAELTVKRLETKPIKRLVPANPAYNPIDTEGMDVEIIGVVTFSIKQHSP